MVRVSKDFRRRRISPATRQRRAAEQGGCQAHAMFPERRLARNYRQTRRPRLNSRPNKHRRRLLAEEAPSRIGWNYKLERRGRTTSWDVVVTRPEK
eukprot:2484695-Heterocapsa_arctica.AAC.1